MRKNKKILLALFLVCLTVLVIPFFDYGYIKANAANSGSYTYIVINGEAVIVDVDDAISGDIVIPDRFGIFKVTKIGENAFDGCMNVKKISLGRFIKDFYSNTFSGCSVTEFSVNKDNNLIFGGSDGCIYNRNKTVLFTYPCGNERTDFTVPDGVTRIFDRAFFSADNLSEIILPDSVEQFEWVYNCPKLDYSGIKTDNKELWEGIEINQLDGLLHRD